jgi:ankyrin repeat protein
VIVLVNNGADVNATDHNGQTPRQIVFTKGYADIVEVLLNKKAEDKEAKVRARNKRGRTIRKTEIENNTPKKRKR